MIPFLFSDDASFMDDMVSFFFSPGKVYIYLKNSITKYINFLSSKLNENIIHL